MKRTTKLALIAAVAFATVPMAANAQQSQMTFFISSAGSGKGADLGGLDGADALCVGLAKAAGASATTWRAYLSTTGAKSVNARDRVGRGPWQNAKGEIVAKTLDELHGKNNLNKQTALNEKGEVVNGRGDKPNMHDILTGSDSEGRAVGGGDKDTTCNNWTSSDAGSAIVGHHDRQGLDSPADVVLELVARLERLQSASAGRHRRRRPDLLLRRELTFKPRMRACIIVPSPLAGLLQNSPDVIRFSRAHREIRR